MRRRPALGTHALDALRRRADRPRLRLTMLLDGRDSGHARARHGGGDRDLRRDGLDGDAACRRGGAAGGGAARGRGDAAGRPSLPRRAPPRRLPERRRAPPATAAAAVAALAARPSRRSTASTAALRPNVGATGQDRRRSPWPADGDAVGPAGLALAQVAPQTAPAAVRRRGRTRAAPRMSSHGVQRASRSATSVLRAWNTSALTLRRRAAEHGGDLRLAEAAQLEQHERLALVVGQQAEVGDQLAQLGAAPDVLGEAVEAPLDLLHRHGCVAAAPPASCGSGCGRSRTATSAARPAAGPEDSARWARTKVCCSASSPSSRLPSMCRQNASSARVMAVVERLERGGVALAHQRRRGGGRRAGGAVSRPQGRRRPAGLFPCGSRWSRKNAQNSGATAKPAGLLPPFGYGGAAREHRRSGTPATGA